MLRHTLDRLIYVRGLAFSAVLAFVFVVTASCTTPADNQGATAQLIGKGFAQVVPDPYHKGSVGIRFGLAQLANTDYVSSMETCGGTAGSVIPPLVLSCVGTTLAVPLVVLRKLAMIGQPDVYEHHVYLDGIEQSFVRQSEPNNCWAAALEITRRYLHLHPVSQDQMLQTAKAVCPRVSEQKQGADIYQIVYTIVKTLKQYDLSATNPQFCQDSQCVVKSLITRHPVIMFKSGHAVVIVGVDFRMDVAGDNTGTFPVVEFLYVLDPAGTGVVEKWSTVSFCQADGFLAY